MSNNNSGCSMFFGGISAIVMLFICYAISPIIFWTVFAIAVIIPVSIFINKNKKDEEREKEAKDRLNYLQKHNCPSECKSFNYISGISVYPQKQPLFVWTENKNLYFLDNNDVKFALPVSDIDFYSIKGDMKTGTEFIGGNNKSVGGTMITEGLFGTAAAMKNNK